MIHCQPYYAPAVAERRQVLKVRLEERVREFVRARSNLRRLYLWTRFAPGAEIRRRRQLRENGQEWEPELREASRISKSGFYDLQLPMANALQPHQGSNFLGYPPMFGMTYAGADIGWHVEQQVSFGSGSLPSFQVRTDLDVNLPLLFETYSPGLAVDFGTAAGASSVLFAQLMEKLGTSGRVLTIDLNDPTHGRDGETFKKALEELPITSHVGDALSAETRAVVKEFLELRQDESVLFSFDDDHSANHVLEELRVYSPLLREGDAVVVQDTWDQGFRDTSFSALLGVLRFLKERDDFELGLRVLRELVLPCSFVHGVIVRKAVGAD